MSVYLLRKGDGKALAIYSRCEPELLCRAELLVLLENSETRFPEQKDKPIHGYYDVDPTFSRSEFLKSYEKDPVRYQKLQNATRVVETNGWNFPLILPGMPLSH